MYGEMIKSIVPVEGIIEERNIPLSLKELSLHTIIRAVGGRILIKKINDSIPPIACTHEYCYELAEYVVLFIDTGRINDCMATLCDEHLDYVYELAGKDVRTQCN